MRKNQKGFYTSGQCVSVTRLGKILPTFYLTNFHLIKAVLAHGLLKLFQGFKSCLMYLIWAFKLNFEVNILSCLGYFF